MVFHYKMKKFFALFAFCAALFVTCFANGGALDLASKNIKLISTGDDKYYCRGNSSFASCKFSSIGDDNFFSINNLVLEVEYHNQDMMIRRVSGNISSHLDYISQRMFPKYFACEDHISLGKNNKLDSVSKCTIKSELVSINIDLDSFLVSDTFRYKDFYSIQIDNLKKVLEFQNNLNKASGYFGRVNVLYEFIEWLGYYNFGINEAKISIHAPNLSNYLFDNNAKRYELYDNKKIEAYRSYYGDLESLLAYVKYKINNDKKLNATTKKNINKIMSNFANLLDPHSSKKSINILVRSNDDTTINFGVLLRFGMSSISDCIYYILDKYDIRSM